MRSKQVLSLWVSVDLGVMAMKGYSILPRSPELEPHHQMKFSVIHRMTPPTFFAGEGYPFCNEYHQHILSPVDMVHIYLEKNRLTKDKMYCMQNDVTYEKKKGRLYGKSRLICFLIYYSTKMRSTSDKEKKHATILFSFQPYFP